jgi:hypothetical protein
MQLIDGLLIELDDASVGLPLHRIPQGCVADVFQQQDTALAGIDIHCGYGDTELDEEAVDVEVGQLFRGFSEHRQLVGRHGGTAVGQQHCHRGCRCS